jgi:putative transposase
MELIAEACLAGARKHKACELLGVTVRTLERWEKDGGLHDKRKIVQRTPVNKLTFEERNMILETANNADYRDLPPCKIVPLLADEGRYMASESTFYRILRAENQLTHRQLSRSAKHHRAKTYIAHSPNQVWTWDISYLPTQVFGLYFLFVYDS